MSDTNGHNSPLVMPTIQSALSILNVGRNSILVLNRRSIDPEVIIEDRALCAWLASRGVCPQIICCIPATTDERLEEAIKTISIDELERILTEAKAHAVRATVNVPTSSMGDGGQ
jgi:hypothetical protein